MGSSHHCTIHWSLLLWWMWPSVWLRLAHNGLLALCTYTKHTTVPFIWRHECTQVFAWSMRLLLGNALHISISHWIFLQFTPLVPSYKCDWLSGYICYWFWVLYWCFTLLDPVPSTLDDIPHLWQVDWLLLQWCSQPSARLCRSCCWNERHGMSNCSIIMVAAVKVEVCFCKHK